MQLHLSLLVTLSVIIGVVIVSALVSNSFFKNAVVHYKENQGQWARSTNLSIWYQPWELCLLNGKESTVGMRARSVIRDCVLDTIPVKPVGDTTFYCRAGGSFQGKMCAATEVNSDIDELWGRPYLQKAIVGYDDPSVSYFKDVLLELTLQNFSFVTVGDSMMSNLVHGMVCEAHRSGLALFDSNHWASAFPPILHDGDIHTYWSAVHRHTASDQQALQEIDRIVNTMLRKTKGVYFLLNLGMHYNNRSAFEKDMISYLPYLQQVAANWQPYVRFVYLESARQHFDTANGYWGGNKTKCVPIRDSSFENDWRNFIVHDIVRKFGLSHIHIITQAERTVPLYREHTQGHYHDCTHYCWSPMMYQPVYADILAHLRSFST